MQNMRFKGIIVAYAVLVGVCLQAMDNQKTKRQNMSCWQLCIAALGAYLSVANPVEAAQAHSYWNINGPCGVATVRLLNVPLPSGTNQAQAHSLINEACCRSLRLKECHEPLKVWQGDGICNRKGHYDCGPKFEEIERLMNEVNQEWMQKNAKQTLIARAGSSSKVKSA